MRPGTLLRWRVLRGILLAEIQEGATVIDVGSYDGAICAQLLSLMPALDITVIDIDEEGLRLARQKGLKALYGSILELPLRDKAADVVLCLDLLEHIREQEKMIREVSRILKPAGKLILTTPMQDGISFPFLSKERNAAINELWGHVRKGYSREELNNLLNEYDFSIVKTSRYFNLPSRIGYWLSEFCGVRVPGRKSLYRLAIQAEPYVKFRAQEHIVVAQKKVNSNPGAKLL